MIAVNGEKGERNPGGGDSTWDLQQTRTSSAVNEITKVAEAAGPSDAWNRLVKLEEGEDTVAEYVHDGDKRRVIKKSYKSGQLDETRHFYYTDPQKWQVIEERVESGGEISATPDRQFVWGRHYIDDLILRDRDADSNGILDERLCALQDANWNVTALADTSGEVQERYAYSACGIPRVLTPTFTTRASSSYDVDVLCAGYRSDCETGLCHMRNRSLHPCIGGCTQRGLLGYAAGSNLYEYVTGRPTCVTDPSGMFAGLAGCLLGGLPDLIGGIGGGTQGMICGAGSRCAGGIVAELTATILGPFAGCIWGAVTRVLNGLCLDLGKALCLENPCLFFDLILGTVLGCVGGAVDADDPMQLADYAKLWVTTLLNTAFGVACSAGDFWD